MRLWHYKIIHYLPNSQLCAQWRELHSIFKKKDKHILINYIYDYDKEYLRTYTWEVINEMMRRGYKIGVDSMTSACDFFGGKMFDSCNRSLHFREHNLGYLRQCFYNLQEKFERGQKDFTVDRYGKLADFYMEEMKNGNDTE